MISLKLYNEALLASISVSFLFDLNIKSRREFLMDSLTLLPDSLVAVELA